MFFQNLFLPETAALKVLMKIENNNNDDNEHSTTRIDCFGNAGGT
ncbi:hypothetical protein T03_7713 [Trichinella britovi]|uniref:Uncharacterized protein n=1 Tax=Trichinella britovi TaxID=45882 RepID=A0A0V0ZTL8_TRIBR|nr:hypothetical protein T03_7713 [Trichinella britovi]